MINGSVQIRPRATDLQVRFIHVPASATGATLAAPAPTKLLHQHRCELRLPGAGGFMAEHEAALEEHLGQVTQSQAVTQPPQHHAGDDVRWVLGVVQQPSATLVELFASVVAAKSTVALGGALRPLRDLCQAAGHTIHLRPLSRSLTEPKAGEALNSAGKP